MYILGCGYVLCPSGRQLRCVSAASLPCKPPRLMQACRGSGPGAVISYRASDGLQSISRPKSLVKTTKHPLFLLAVDQSLRPDVFRVKTALRGLTSAADRSRKIDLAPNKDRFFLPFFLFSILLLIHFFISRKPHR